jgi:hypothetical protein
MWVLFEHLLNGVFGAEEDASRIDVLRALPDISGNLPDRTEFLRFE